MQDLSAQNKLEIMQNNIILWAEKDILKTLFEVFLCDYQEIFSFQIRVPGAEC